MFAPRPQPHFTPEPRRFVTGSSPVSCPRNTWRVLLVTLAMIPGRPAMKREIRQEFRMRDARDFWPPQQNLWVIFGENLRYRFGGKWNEKAKRKAAKAQGRKDRHGASGASLGELREGWQPRRGIRSDSDLSRKETGSSSSMKPDTCAGQARRLITPGFAPATFTTTLSTQTRSRGGKRRGITAYTL